MEKYKTRVFSKKYRIVKMGVDFHFFILLKFSNFLLFLCFLHFQRFLVLSPCCSVLNGKLLGIFIACKVFSWRPDRVFSTFSNLPTKRSAIKYNSLQYIRLRKTFNNVSMNRSALKYNSLQKFNE